MKLSVKEQWLTALRSGNYAQGEAALNQGGKFCCLGVLCDIAVKNNVVPDDYVTTEHIDKWDEDGNMISVPRVSYFDADMFLPHRVAEWAGLGIDPEVDVPNGGQLERVNLATLNDGGKTFAELADLIEDQL